MKPAALNRAHIPRVAAVAAAVGGAAACTWRFSQRQAEAPGVQVKLPAPLVDGLAGALGEVAQILVLYPLDTIKVRCQSSGETAGVVVKRLLRKGFNVALLKKLYAGAVGAAACAVLVGAVHFASYEWSRKAILKVAAPRGAAATGLQASDSARSAAAQAAGGGEAGAADGAASGGSLAEAEAAQRVARTAATFGAAAFAALATALVESPVELFRHNAQAGLVQSNFLREMVTTVRREGFGGLYWGFLPHCFEALPHDMSELATYGSMREFEEAARRPGSRHHAWMRGVPHQTWDLVTGAASGAAAVLLSMPFDTVKTYLQTHGADLSGRGLLGSAALFIKSGRRILTRKGPAGLYVGVTPRLFQQVPSAMVCWVTIAAVKRWAEPWTLPDEDGADDSSCGHLHTH